MKTVEQNKSGPV